MRTLFLALALLVAVVMPAWSRSMAPTFCTQYIEATKSVQCTSISSYVAFPVSAWTTKVSKNVTVAANTNGQVTIVHKGWYLVSFTSSFDGVNGHNYDFCLFKNGAEIPCCESKNTAKASSGYSVTAFVVMTYFASGDVLRPLIADSSGTGIVNVNRAGFTIVRLAP